MGEKRIACKKCGAQVAPGEKKCPSCGVENPTINRKDVIGFLVVGIITVGLLSQCIGGSSYEDYADVKLKEIRELTGSEQKEILGDYLAQSDINEEYSYEFFRCMSDMVNSKADDLSLSKVMGWCKTEFESNGKSFIRYYVDYQKLKSQFSLYDGSHRELEQLIKNNMNDSGSYEHVQTRYRVVKDGEDSYVALVTEFRGANAFGGIVKQTVHAKADLQTGEIIEIIQ